MAKVRKRGEGKRAKRAGRGPRVRGVQAMLVVETEALSRVPKAMLHGLMSQLDDPGVASRVVGGLVALLVAESVVQGGEARTRLRWRTMQVLPGQPGVGAQALAMLAAGVRRG